MVTVTPPAATFVLDGVAPRVSARTDYHPSVADVATVLRARTKDDNGDEIGSFTTATRPTAFQVADLIDGAVAEVKMRLGDSFPARLFPTARQAVVLNAAAAVERSYYPEQAANRDNSAYQLFKDDYNELIGQLVEAIADPTVGTRGAVSIDMSTSTSSSATDWYLYDGLLP